MRLSKIVILGVLLIGLETQLIAYYSIPERKDIANQVESLTPTPPVKQLITNQVIEVASDGAISSNIIMIWHDKGNSGYHSFDAKEIALLQRVARSLQPKQFEDLMDQAKHMSTTEFVSYVRERENLLLASSRMARVN